MTQPYDERAERKRYIRRRQQIVFSCVGAVLAVALVVSARVTPSCAICT